MVIFHSECFREIAGANFLGVSQLAPAELFGLVEPLDPGSLVALVPGYPNPKVNGLMFHGKILTGNFSYDIRDFPVFFPFNQSI